MSREIGRRKTETVQVGPDLRRVKVPLILTIGTVLLILDSARWHLVHHLLGASSGLIVSFVMIIWAIWGAIKFRKRRNR